VINCQASATISTFRWWIKVHSTPVCESGVTHPQSRDYSLVSSRECLCAVIFINSWFDCDHRVVRWCLFFLSYSFLFLPYSVFQSSATVLKGFFQGSEATQSITKNYPIRLNWVSYYRDNCVNCFGFSIKDWKKVFAVESPCFHLGWLLRILLSPAFLICPFIFGCYPGSLRLGFLPTLLFWVCLILWGELAFLCWYDLHV
jgi:hypothetical protein